MFEYINPEERQRLNQIGVTMNDLLTYVADRKGGLDHALAVDRLFSKRDHLLEHERIFVSESLGLLPVAR